MRLAIVLLAACATAAPRAPLALPAAQPAYFSGAAWTMLLGAEVTTPDVLDSQFVRPAFSCSYMHIVDFDGARWRCRSVLSLSSGARQ